MKKTISPSTITGEVRAPSSKSLMLRGIVAGLLASGETLIKNPSLCDDALSALKISEQLGAEVKLSSDLVRITGGFKPEEETLHCGESGLGIRMFSAVASLHNSTIQLTGSGSLENRSVNMIEKPLRELGVDCKTSNGFLPIHVKGPLKGGKASVDGSESSQLLTGLLMSLPVVSENSDLFVKDLKSRPYIDITLKVLSDFGIKIENQDYRSFRIPGNQEYRAGEYVIEGDWSGAAFLLTAGALNGSVRVTGIQPESLQADCQILSVLEMAGAQITVEEESVEITSGGQNPFHFDATECPDLFPPMVALAAHCNGITVLSGIHRLISKESNRAMVLQQEFANLGVPIELADDKMIIQGGIVRSGSVDANNDHRIAMSAAITGIKATGNVEINGAECVTKSYPYFFEDFIKIGGIAYE